MTTGGVGGGRGGRGGNNNGRKQLAGKTRDNMHAASWMRRSREDGTAVLIALVRSVTTATAAARSAAAGSGRDGGGSSGGGGAGGRGVERFNVQESEALSLVCEEALRALVRRIRSTMRFLVIVV